MAQFCYLGNHAETETLGFRFRAGTPTEVNDAEAIRKLRNNNHFSEVFDGVEIMPDASPTQREESSIPVDVQNVMRKARGRPPRVR